MQTIKEKEALKQTLQDYRKEGLSIAFVPTMGALHEGHLSLIKAALRSSDKVVVSIFVNPTQFDNPSDLEKYPRTLEKDIELILEVSKDVLVFTPSAKEIYGEEISSEKFDFGGLEYKMEGRYRKGHFDGVGTVVKRLFEIVQPDKAFFGEKDFQQLQIVKRLVRSLDQDIKVIGCPVDREESGLARSSRNERLSPSNRQQAGKIFAVLSRVKEDFGIKSVPEIKSWVQEEFDSDPSLKLEYFEIADEESLSSADQIVDNKAYRAFIAAYSGDIRLIDNIALN